MLRVVPPCLVCIPPISAVSSRPLIYIYTSQAFVLPSSRVEIIYNVKIRIRMTGLNIELKLRKTTSYVARPDLSLARTPLK